MKVDTTNYLSLPSTLSNKETRLIVCTGKGGVGKTTLAMGLTKALQAQGKSVLYNCFDQPLNDELVKKLDLPHFTLEMEKSAKEYIAKKLGSETIAGWILKTPFFSSLFNMLPGLGHMILLGHIINKLEEDPELIIVLDSPSSGHALTMFESPGNFKEMFRKGLIVDDILKMENFIFTHHRMNVIVSSLPTKMALSEAHDLEVQLRERGVHKIQHVMNDVLTECPELKDAPAENLPEFLKKKLDLEQEVFDLIDPTQTWFFLPHFGDGNNVDVIKDCAKLIKEQP